MMIGYVLRRLIFNVVMICARWSLPRPIDGAAARIAVGAIRCYRLIFSPFVGQDCLFKTTCSHFAETALTQRGWSIGWPEAAARLQDCGGDHCVLTLTDGTKRLQSASGRIYGEDLLAERFINATNLHAPR